MTRVSRGHDRSNVFLGAALHAAGTSAPVRIRNLSMAGALLEGAGLPSEGTRVELRRGSLVARGEVAWAGGAQRGMRFDEGIDVAAWVRPIGHLGQRRVDLALNSIRSDAAWPATTNEGVSSGNSRLAALAGQIRDITERLAAAPTLGTELAEELLKLDAIAHDLLQFARG